MDVTLGQLLAQVEWLEIKAALCNLMGVEPAAMPSHQKVYEHILGLPACPSGFTFVIARGEDGGNNSPVEVSARWTRPVSEAPAEIRQALLDEGPDTCFGFELEPWENWLGLLVDQDTRQVFSPAEIVAACLWEMSYVAFDEETISQLADHLQTAKTKDDDGKTSSKSGAKST